MDDTTPRCFLFHAQEQQTYAYSSEESFRSGPRVVPSSLALMCYLQHFLAKQSGRARKPSGRTSSAGEYEKEAGRVVLAVCEAEGLALCTRDG